MGRELAGNEGRPPQAGWAQNWAQRGSVFLGVVSK